MAPANEFARLVEIVHALRDGCPWDRSQDHESLRACLLEEAYEVLHALDEGSCEALREELGDLMLQIVLHAEIAQEERVFDIEDVLRSINDKLVRRHPHVFGGAEAPTPDDAVRRWEAIKADEGKNRSVLDGVPDRLPALLRAVRVLEKVRHAGVDPFANRDPVEAARTWLRRLSEAAAAGNAPLAREATGRLCLAISVIAGRAELNPEDSLRVALRKLSQAFAAEEACLRRQGKGFDDLTDGELNEVAARIWPERGEA